LNTRVSPVSVVVCPATARRPFRLGLFSVRAGRAGPP